MRGEGGMGKTQGQPRKATHVQTSEYVPKTLTFNHGEYNFNVVAFIQVRGYEHSDWSKPMVCYTDKLVKNCFLRLVTVFYKSNRLHFLLVYRRKKPARNVGRTREKPVNHEPEASDFTSSSVLPASQAALTFQSVDKS